MRRIVAVELRRSMAPVVALLMLAVTAWILWPGRSAFGETWTRLAFVSRGSLFLGCPLALAAGAWQARRDRPAPVAELIGSTSRPRVIAVLPLSGAAAIAVAGPYLLVTAAAAGSIRGRTDYLPASAVVAVLVGALGLVASVWLGLAVGRLLPFLVTAPALAVLGFGLLVATAWGRGNWTTSLLSLPAPRITGLQDEEFLVLSGRMNLAQASWLLAVAVTSILLLAAGRRRARAAALLPAVLGLLAAALVMPRHGSVPGVEVDRTATALVCTRDTPKVCVARVHSARLARITPAAREALHRMARLPGAPTVAAEDVDATARDVEIPPMSRDTAYFPFTLGSTRSSLLDVVDVPSGPLTTPPGSSLLLGAGTGSRYICTGGLFGVAAKSAVRYWLLGVEPSPRAESSEPGVHALWQVLHQVPEQEAARRVAALREAALTCSDGLAGVLRGRPAGGTS